MITKKIRTLALIGLLTIILISVVTALAANNIVPVTRLTDQSSAVPASALAPPECDSIRNSLAAIIECGGGICNGTNANELIFGTAGSDIIDGKNGEDCIVGGSGDDALSGDNGNDVLVGGPGSDTLDGGKRKKDTDICVDEAGSTTFIDCEVIR
jgi:Ca2+-binding RTX toxin-like protein